MAQIAIRNFKRSVKHWKNYVLSMKTNKAYKSESKNNITELNKISNNCTILENDVCIAFVEIPNVSDECRSQFALMLKEMQAIKNYLTVGGINTCKNIFEPRWGTKSCFDAFVDNYEAIDFETKEDVYQELLSLRLMFQNIINESKAKDSLIEDLQNQLQISKKTVSRLETILDQVLGTEDEPKQQQNKETEECAICLEDMAQNYIKTECNHTFHIQCLNDWQMIDKTCPTCRGDL